MKTAISIPNNVFESAEELANRLGQSRSQLYTQALSSYLARYQSDNLTERLNKIYDGADSTLDIGLASLQSKSIFKDKW